MGAFSCPPERPKSPAKKRMATAIFILAPDSVSLLAGARRHSDAKHKRSRMLIRKSSKPGSPHPSRIRFLDNHRDPNIPWLFGAEIKFHVSAKPCGLIYCSDSDQAS